MPRRPSLLSAAATGAAILAAFVLLPLDSGFERVPETVPRSTPSDGGAGSGTTAATETTNRRGGDRDEVDAGAVDAGGLQPGLTAALERARAAAAADEVELPVGSGYRSAQEQAALLEAEIAERGDAEEARRWVFPPEQSMHVRGLAIDVNSGPGADWLESHGDRFGLCRTLAWEWWHFEWREAWERDESCPAPARSLDEVPAS